VPLPKPVPGLVIHYAYLWNAQHRQGLEEGLKDRPCVIVSVSESKEGTLIVRVAPITHAPPARPEDGIELPHPTKQRLGLDDQRSWVLSTEVNRFTWPGLDLRSIPSRPGVFAYGVLPPALHAHLIENVMVAAREQRLQATPRDEH